MNRLEKEFTNLRAKNRGGFIPFIVAGDPNRATTKDLIFKLADGGANVVELGVPFSDPVADGATIQRSAERALLNKIGVGDISGAIFKTCATACADSSAGIIPSICDKT